LNEFAASFLDSEVEVDIFGIAGGIEGGPDDGRAEGERDGGPGGALTSAPSRVLGVILFTLGFFVFESKRTIVPGPGGGGFDPDPGGPGGERAEGERDGLGGLGVILFTLVFFVFESKRTLVPGPGGGGLDPEPDGPGGPGDPGGPGGDGLLDAFGAAGLDTVAPGATNKKKTIKIW